MPDGQFDYDVFISYSHENEDWVHQWLLPRLKKAGLCTCIDMEDFAVGAPSLTEMERAVVQSAKTLLVLTPEYLASEWTEFENILTQTLDPAARQRRVIPLLLEDCDRPPRIAMLTYADFRPEGRREKELGRVVAAIKGERVAARGAGKTDSGLVPLPPLPHFAHPYPLQEHFTGRVRYRKMLTQWLVGGDCPVFCVTAIGGTGKSALSWAWVQRDVLGNQLPGAAADRPEDAAACCVPEDSRPEGILWWSFYERQSTFGAFLNEALAYTTGGQVNPADIPSDYDKARTLLNLLRQRRILLVLDGFERQLRAYARLDAAYQGDAVTEDDRANFRSCADPHAARFLQEAAALPLRSRLLLTSRLFPACLGGMGGCKHEDLTDMQPEEAVAFLDAYRIKGTRAEKEEACRPYGYHPFSLRLLAGLIVKDKQDPRDIRAAKRHPIVPELKGKERHHILTVSYDTLEKEKQTLLSQMAAFRSPMAYDAIAHLNPYKTGEEFDVALQELIDRGLLLHDLEENRYDLHPVVRQYAYERLTDREREGTHTRLRDYFSAVPQPEKAEKLENLAPTIELYHHTVGAGRYDDAARLLRDRLGDPLFYRFGAYFTYIELLRALFPEGEDKPPRLATERTQSWTCTALANSYSLSGHPRRAEAIQAMGNGLDEKAADRLNLAIGLSNLATTQRSLGQLAAAEQNLHRRIALCREIDDEWREATGHLELCCLLSHEAAFDRAAAEADTALAAFTKVGDTQGQGIVWAYRALRALLMGDPTAAPDAARRARELAYQQARSGKPNQRDLTRAEWLQGAGLVALAASKEAKRTQHLNEAEDQLTEALTRCRRINLVELEPDILLAWAKWHHLKGDAAQARKDAEEALTVADRCEYRLAQADCHNFLAAFSQHEGDTKAAIEHARTAYERAWCDGPPHCYKPALEEAERLLNSLGAAPPRMS